MGFSGKASVEAGVQDVIALKVEEPVTCEYSPSYAVPFTVRAVTTGTILSRNKQELMPGRVIYL